MATMQSSAADAAASKQQLASEHARLEFQLERLNHKPHLSPEEEVEETELKKLKLRVKDALRRLEA